jgi:5-(carboxyamino)imidazole ribonucleotide mutase
MLAPAPALVYESRPMDAPSTQAPLVGVIMGSKSDWEWMQHVCITLEALGVSYEARVVSAHRTPDEMFRYAEEAEARGLAVIVAGAGGAAHLPGMVAAKTVVPVLGVPIPATLMQGVDALLSIAQMPGGIPVGTLAVGKPGAVNAAVLAAQIVGTKDSAVRERVKAWRAARTEEALSMKVGLST